MAEKHTRLVDEAVLNAARWQRCCICSVVAPNDPSHIRSRGAGGPDTTWNVVPMCRVHHNEWHQWGPSRFLIAYPVFGIVLRRLGWEVWRPDYGAIKLLHPELKLP